MARWSERRPPEDYYRIVAPDGSLERSPPDLDDETRVDFYRTMVLSRRLDEKMFSMQRQGELSLIARVLGEEATPLGTAAALEPGDWSFPKYRQAPAYFHWGMPPESHIAGRKGFEPETIAEHLDLPALDVNFVSTGAALAVNFPNAVGVGMTEQFTDGDSVVMAYIGDGATSEGDFHEALTFAGVFDVPVVFVCQNNQWAISVPSHRQTPSDTFAQKAESYNIPNQRVDGNDVLAVFEQTKEMVERARDGGGPGFIEAVTYRRAEHNTADNPDDYRDDAELEYWEERDPLSRYETYLLDEGLLTEEAIEEIEATVEERIATAVERVREIPPSDPELLFANHYQDGFRPHDQQRSELRRELAGANPFLERDAVGGGNASVTPFLREGTADESVNLVTAVRDSLGLEMARDESIRLLGYDIGPMGGVFRATEGLYDEFGADRVIDTPLSENGILGTAVGMALAGDRVVPEIQFMGFLYPGFGQFVYTLAKTYERTTGRYEVPITVRIPYGGGIKSSEFHSESTESYLVHTPGVRVVVPSTPYETRGLLAASIRSDDPVVFLEPKKIYRGLTEPVPDEEFTLPLDTARVVHEGSDVTVLTWGAMVRHAMEAADEVDADVEVLDLRSLSPLDVDSIVDSVQKTGRAVVFHEARRTLGVGSEISALLNEHALYYLEAPIVRATGYDVHFPGHQLEDVYLPDVKRATHAIEAVMQDSF